MKEAIIETNLQVNIHDVPVAVAGPGQVLIRTVVSGVNPKDWKAPKLWFQKAGNYGDDIAGYIEAVGEGVVGFHPGDRVAAFHQMFAPGGSYAEFSLAWAKSTFHLPETVSFEEGATIPLVVMTAALGLYQRLQLPLPWSPATAKTPFVVNGGATSVGAFAIKLAALSNIHPIIAIAGNGGSFVETLIDRSKGDTIVDYRQGNAHLVKESRKAAGGDPIIYAFDAISENGSTKLLSEIVAPGDGKINAVFPTGEDKSTLGVEVYQTMVGTVHESEAQGPGKLGDSAFGAVFFHFIGVSLAEGWISGHPYEVVRDGLSGLEEALKALEMGKVSSKKFVIRLADTPGVSAKPNTSG